jgi:predicted ATPase/DNA-binding winged helix-turn-helix (wHTH) protein
LQRLQTNGKHLKWGTENPLLFCAAVPRKLRFDPFELSLDQRELRRAGAVLPLGQRALDILIYLVERPGEVVTKKELIDHAWPDVVVEEGSLRVHIVAIRKALGDRKSGYRYITNIQGRGYSFVGSVVKVDDQTDSPTGQCEGNLPARARRLVGRGLILSEVQGSLREERFVTLIGPGGIGKSSLAIEVGRGILDEFRGGGWLVELASLADEDLVPSAVASVLGLKLQDGAISAEVVSRAIGNANLLLILDNCEHVIDAAAELAEAVVRFCPRVSVLATSREALRIDGEQVHRVPALSVPEVGREEPEQVLYCEAVELLIERIRALDRAFSPALNDLPSLAAICRRLDGIPLAIEFAAARAATIGLRQVVVGLDDRFQLLTRGWRTALPRHQTLRAALDWSYELLPDAERRMLRRLGVFAGGLTVDSAAAVMADTGLDAAMVTDCIANLVAKSLIALDPTPGAMRWYLLETIRAYALRKLAESGESDDALRRHATFFRDLFAPGALADDLARREIDNVRAALDWSFSSDGDAAVGVTLAAAFAPVWIDLSLVAECRTRAEHVRGILRPDLQLTRALELRLLMALGVALTLTLGSIEQTREVIAKARQLAFDIDDREAQLRMLWAQFSMEMNLGEHRTALGTARQFVELARRQGDDALTLVGERFLGTSMFRAGELNAARSCLERMVKHYVAPPSGHHTILFHYGQRAIARANLAHVLSLQGSLDWAREQVRLSLEEARNADMVTFCWVLHNGAIPLAFMTGDLAAADEATATMNDLATHLDAALWKIIGRCWEGKLLIGRRQFAQGTALLREALQLRERKGWMGMSEFAGDLACGLAGLERFDEAIATLDRALDRGKSGGGSWCQSEFIRIKGEVLLQQGPQNEALAEDCFQAAAQLAHAQCALYWELWVALSVARLRVSQGRHHEARAPLASVYDRFTEGFATADLQAARTLLEELPP